MRRTTSILTVLIFSALFVGCTGSPYPLSDPGDAAIRGELLGTWESVDPDDEENVARAQVWAFNDFEYLVYYTEPDDPEEEVMLRLFESEFDGGLIANLQCFVCDEDERGWLFTTLEVRGDQLSMRWVDDDLYDETEEASNSYEVMSVFRKRLRENTLFDDETWDWYRVED